jgi:hypothetical protein
VDVVLAMTHSGRAGMQHDGRIVEGLAWLLAAQLLGGRHGLGGDDVENHRSEPKRRRVGVHPCMGLARGAERGGWSGRGRVVVWLAAAESARCCYSAGSNASGIGGMSPSTMTPS